MISLCFFSIVSNETNFLHLNDTDSDNDSDYHSHLESVLLITNRYKKGVYILDKVGRMEQSTKENEMNERNVSIRLTKVDGYYAYHQETIVTGVDWSDDYFRRYNEVLMMKDFGNFGELEFATYDWRN